MTQRAGPSRASGPISAICWQGQSRARGGAGRPEILPKRLSSPAGATSGMSGPGPAQLAGSLPPATSLTAARRLLTDLSALEGDRLSAHGRKMALGNDPRLAAMRQPRRMPMAPPATKLAAILEEPAARIA